MPTDLYVDPINLEITVAGGTGSASFKATGRLAQCCFKPSSGTPAFSYQLLDADNYLLSGRSGLTGLTTVDINKLCKGTITLQITGDNGTYLVRLYLEYGFYATR